MKQIITTNGNQTSTLVWSFLCSPPSPPNVCVCVCEPDFLSPLSFCGVRGKYKPVPFSLYNGEPQRVMEIKEQQRRKKHFRTAELC